MLAGLAVLVVLSVVYLSGSPSPKKETVESPSRDLDDAAEEVRAVATGMRRLEEKISDQAARVQKLDEVILRIDQRLDQQQVELTQALEQPVLTKPLEPDAETDIPEAEPFDLGTLVNAPLESESAAIQDRAVVWVESIQSDGLLRSHLPIGLGAAGESENAQGDTARFTIPPAVLSGVSLTALVGRVPQSGSVQDPWPFLVVSTADNFTANGMNLPHLRGILWRGVVRGDAVLSCASASIRSLVYVFEDGVFHVARSADEGGLGYLADEHGNPCLSGTLHTTAPENLTTQLLASALAGLGGAFAEEQIDRTTTADGSNSSSIQGDAFKYLLGQTVQGAAQTYSDYLARYASDTWDAVVVPAGQPVDIHIHDAIPVAYRPERRIYEDAAKPVAVVGGLD